MKTKRIKKLKEIMTVTCNSQSMLQLKKEICPILLKLGEKEIIERGAKSPPKCY